MNSTRACVYARKVLYTDFVCLRAIGLVTLGKLPFFPARKGIFLRCVALRCVLK